MAQRWHDDRDGRVRGLMDRIHDEVRSWFGDDEANKRRRVDHDRDPMYRSTDDPDDERSSYSRERGDTHRFRVDRDDDRRREDARYRRSWEDRDERGVRSVGGAARHDAPSVGRQSSTAYAGRGPRDYRRADERIREDVCDRLTDDPHVDASDIMVTVSNGEVSLAGTVATRAQKRRAEDVAEQARGVLDVNNQLRLHQEAHYPGATSHESAPTGRGPAAGGVHGARAPVDPDSPAGHEQGDLHPDRRVE